MIEYFFLFAGFLVGVLMTSMISSGKLKDKDVQIGILLNKLESKNRQLMHEQTLRIYEETQKNN